MSGLSRTPGKRVWANTHRGFESRPLRQELSKHGPSGPVLHFAAPHRQTSRSAVHPWKGAVRRVRMADMESLVNTAALPCTPQGGS